jgi:hypothetical protein
MTTATLAQLGQVPAKNKAATADVLAACARQGIKLAQVWGVGPGDHADGHATDFMVYNDQAAGDWIADYLWTNRARLGVRWVIWRQRIRSTSPGKPGTWQPMEDRGNRTKNHYDHVHVKWTTAAVQPPPAPTPPRRPARPRIRVAALRPRSTGADVRAYNALLWKAQGPIYKARNLVAWMRESSNVYGRMTERVTFDTYAYLHKKDPKNWGPAPSRPAWPGPELVRHLGGDPV